MSNEPDPKLHCDQCGKPQWADGSGLCSWRACAETGSCDGRQVCDRTMQCGHTPEDCDCDPTPEQEEQAAREERYWDGEDQS